LISSRVSFGSMPRSSAPTRTTRERGRVRDSSLTVINIYVDGRPEWDRTSADMMRDVLDGRS